MTGKIEFFLNYQYELQLLGFETLPQLTDLDVADPGTLRIKQERRNTFVFSGTSILKRNFGREDSVSI